RGPSSERPRRLVVLRRGERAVHRDPPGGEADASRRRDLRGERVRGPRPRGAVHPHRGPAWRGARVRGRAGGGGGVLAPGDGPRKGSPRDALRSRRGGEADRAVRVDVADLLVVLAEADRKSV